MDLLVALDPVAARMLVRGERAAGDRTPAALS
jgi:hypothetical protein